MFGIYVRGTWRGTDVTSSITYDSSVSTTDDGFVDEYTMLNDTALVPNEVVAMYPPADVTIPLLALFDTMDDGELLPSPSSPPHHHLHLRNDVLTKPRCMHVVHR